MIKPILVFKKNNNSFCVKIQNLEQLEVKQIKELELFVKNRNGMFDFEKYEFTINKNIEFREFVFLIDSLGIEAFCKEESLFVDNQPRISFGQYKGMQFCDLDDTYLIWLKSNYRGSQREFIDNELISRGL